MALKDMALTDSEYKENSPVAIESEAKPSEPVYPYGLCLCLDEVSLKKLGVKNLPEVGQEMMISAKVMVKSVGEYESRHSGVRRNMELQITALEFVPLKKEVDMDKLYDGGKSEVVQTTGKTFGKLNDNPDNYGG